MGFAAEQPGPPPGVVGASVGDERLDIAHESVVWLRDQLAARSDHAAHRLANRLQTVLSSLPEEQHWAVEPDERAILLELLTEADAVPLALESLRARLG